MNEQLTVPGHGSAALPTVTVDAYNAELRDADGFIGDRASKRAFQSILDEWRERLSTVGADPLGDTPTGKVGKRKLEKMLLDGDLEQQGLILTAIEEFAQDLTTVSKRLLRLKTWHDTERIVVGGGFRGSLVGELAIARAGALLKAAGHAVEMTLIRHDPDEAGLVGTAHLVPAWMFAGHDAILGVDIGGTNMRAGLVALPSSSENILADAAVLRSTLWRHRDDKPTREQAVERLIKMLNELIAFAHKKKRKLAPFVGIGCPGIIEDDGSIERGGQNLPGNWESSRFNLPERIQAMLPKIGDHTVSVLIHNDAVVQGLSQLPWMRDVTHWGALTIGTGLGNARFTNRSSE
jgi:hypothetical protein